jgi:transcriptional regulator with XRE-family HTH domain
VRIATEIRGLMGARNLTATDLANHLGVHRWTAAPPHQRRKDLSINELEAIAAWLDVPVTRLIAPASAAGFSA